MMEMKCAKICLIVNVYIINHDDAYIQRCWITLGIKGIPG